MKLRLPTLLAAGGLVALAACVDPADRSGAGTGLVIGATTGAVAGAVTGDGGRDVAQGAIIGGAVGAVAGNVLLRQQQQLEQSFNNPDIRVVNRGNYLQVIMPAAILFGSSSATIAPAAQADLMTLARSLNEFPNSTVEVVGHTDNTGSRAYNLDLSRRRAQSAASVLIQGGVAPSRVRTTGVAYDQPIASNATPEGRAQNRRVEILIHPTR